jgi:FKBP-type peptidyl-prolyl cis-trans isomerase 2
MADKKAKSSDDSNPGVARSGNKVKVHYTGTLDNGMKFDSSEGREPLEFTLGASMVIKGFDNAVEGMKVGEEKTVRIPAAEAYGSRVKELVQDVPMDKVKDSDKFREGMVLTLKGPSGQELNAFVVKIEKGVMTLDLNHPLAGHDLNFTIKLVEIE